MFANLGWKTLAVAGVMVVTAALQLFGVDTSAYTMMTPADLFGAAAALVGLRHAIAKAS